VVLVLSRVTGPVNPGPIDDLVRLGGGGRDASAVDLLFRLTPLYGSQFVIHLRQLLSLICYVLLRSRKPWAFSTSSLASFDALAFMSEMGMISVYIMNKLTHRTAFLMWRTATEKITRENLSHKGILHAHGFSHRLGLSKKDRTVSEAKEIDRSKHGEQVRTSTGRLHCCHRGMFVVAVHRNH